ncbi:MAG: glycosyltransferase family 1 protein [Prevotella sp.]|uniref:glycosyltransferase family 1 protein n=1 Tax=Prevotella sp. TaxID=59823 RepID=UPI002A356247|nr:glycosyltransferase family 1 protein [Prevotella sp.]MDD7319230.1 glycosyltransferase family 1 protein [Prevotellaceae bacterium]MDY4020149.1 glycosyltransferase family 1 protein [Prevotella sp.]
MRILLLGEYSNVHATLAEGLRTLGNEVVVASNGDFWKDYPRDIDLARKPGKIGGLSLYAKILSILPRMRNFDVVQLINPMFLELKAQRIAPIYRQLKRSNGKVFLGAFGMDYYWAKINSEQMPLRYSDFNIGKRLRMNADAVKERKDWIGTPKERLNRRIAEECDGIIAGLYEYYATYSNVFPEKTRFIPMPINTGGVKAHDIAPHEGKIKIFIGISRGRSEYKGTDIMLEAALEVAQRHSQEMEIVKAEGLPFREYRRRMEGSDAILDQLYSYTPSMNSLLAMSKGIICIGGGEPENYDILNETELRPIINVQPCRESVVEQLEWLLAHKKDITQLKRDSVEYVCRHHDHINVACRYLEFWNSESSL